MKIPVYQTGRVGGGTTLPGVSRTARKNPNAMAQAEMDKAAPLLTAMNAATSFMVQRQKMATEIQYNESLLGAEESLRELTLSSIKDPDIGNVFEGENKWSQQVGEVKQNFLGQLTNRGAIAKFNSAFDGLELQYRFKVRGEIDSRYIAREEAALSAQRTKTVETLSDYLNADPDLYNEKFNKLGVLQQPSINDGRANPDAVTVANFEMKKQIATNVINGWVGNDIEKATQLNDAFETIELYRKGGITEQELRQSMPDMVGADYAIHTLIQLNSIAEGDAIIFAALKTAIDRTNLLEKKSEEYDNNQKENRKKGYISIFTIKDSDTFKATDFLQFNMYFNPTEEAAIFGDGPINGETAKQVIFDFFDRNAAWASPTEREKAELELASTIGSGFSATTNEDDLSSITFRASIGSYTFSNLIDDRSKLTAPEFETVRKLILSESDDNLAEFRLFGQNEIGYNPLQDVEGLTSKTVKREYLNYNNELTQFVEDKLAEGLSLTRGQIKDKANELLADVEIRIVKQLKGEYLAQLSSIAALTNNQLVLNSTDSPYAQLEAWNDEKERTLSGNNEALKETRRIYQQTKDKLSTYDKYIEVTY